jgi:hypothetical protein
LGAKRAVRRMRVGNRVFILRCFGAMGMAGFKGRSWARITGAITAPGCSDVNCKTVAEIAIYTGYTRLDLLGNYLGTIFELLRNYLGTIRELWK